MWFPWHFGGPKLYVAERWLRSWRSTFFGQVLERLPPTHLIPTYYSGAALVCFFFLNKGTFSDVVHMRPRFLSGSF